MKNKYWFKRKRYGYGWVPTTWQGVLVSLLFVTVLLAAAYSVKNAFRSTFNTELAVFILLVILSTSAFLQIAYRKGPKPKWRWGKSENDNPDEDF